MINLEIDGKNVQVENGATVMEAANKLGIFVPHFCYHKKLSIAANCRMCLVQVEKAPKPLPACATPATEGMKVQTASDYAKNAQKGVMEFLLINHPLDCPICDQGGECQLQDLAVGYGGSASRYQEEKRVVFHKNIGPLVSMEEMSRCIHCTRCVRFGQEIAGVMELGMAGRGEHSEIQSFVGKTVDSELSGNMIDVCPVGALTSKPFRYSARTWELSRRKSVAPHDSLGSNIIVQVKQDKVMRVLPLENEAINECWISDRDRFSYEALNSADRLQKPMIKKGNLWAEVEWQEALDAVVAETNRVKAQHGASAIALLASPQSTIEELHLAAKLIWGLGSENIESRLRQADKRSDGRVAGARWLGMKVAEVSTLESVLMVGATLRNEQPLLASRFRQAVKKGLQLNVVHSVDDDLLMGVANKEIVKPSALAWVLGGIAKALTELKSASLPNDVANAVAPIEVTPAMLSIAKSLSEKQRTAVFLGNFALHHPAYSTLHVLAQEIARLSGGTLGIWGDGANSVGAEVIGAVPRAAQSSARKAYFLLGVEPALDVYDPSALNSELSQAEVVVAFSSFKSAIPSTATIALPIAPFTETAGTFVNAEGTVQSFNGVVKPLGDTRPAWKVLRVLGNLFGLDGFDQESIEAVRTEIAPDLQAFVSSRLNNVISGIAPDVKMTMGSIERVAEAPIYGGDAMVRRANSLQMTPTAKRARIAMLSRDIFDELGGASSSEVRVTTAIGSVVMSAKCDPALPSGTARIGILPETAALGPVSGTVSIQKVTVAAAAE